MENDKISFNNQKKLKKTSPYNLYIRTYSICIIIFMIPILLNYLFLKNSGEFLSSEEIFEIQNKKGNKDHLYGSALFNDVKELKLYSLKIKKPKIVALGSSRVLQFKESFFSKSFYNFGLAAASGQEAIDTATLMLAIHHPEVVILGVDFWWFNEELLKEATYNIKIPKKTNRIDPAHLLLPFKWIKNGKINFFDYIQFFKISKKRHIGVRGKFQESGFAPDGSHYNTDVITGQDINSRNIDSNITKLMFLKGNSIFRHGTFASEIQFQKFLELLKLFETHNVKVILFFPPLIPEFEDEMKKYDYSYIEDLKEKFREHKINIVDFTFPSENLDTNACEFIDSTHGGDVLYTKILDSLTSENDWLKEYVRQDYLKEVISKYSGMAMIPNLRITIKKEVDFLGRNCKKLID